MSGRPSTVFTWALEQSYASGPNPWQQGAALTKIEPVPDYFTPEAPMPAQWFNWLFNQISLSMQALQDYACNVPALNWWPYAAATTITIPSGMGSVLEIFSRVRWDLASGTNDGEQWIAGGQGITTLPTVFYPVIVTSSDHGQTWTAVGSSTSWSSSSTTAYQAVAGCIDPVSGDYMGASMDSSGNIIVALFNGTSWSSKLTVSTPLGAAGLNMATVASAVVVAASITGASGVFSYLYSTTNSGTSWNQFVNLAGAGEYILKTNGTTLIAMPVFTNYGAFNDSYYSTTDGVHWTTLALPALSSTDQVAGLTWTQDALGPCWILAVNRTSPSKQVVFYRSPDGVTWTLVIQSPSPGLPTLAVSDMTAIGALLLLALKGPSGQGPDYFMFSINGAQSWYLTQNDMIGNASPASTGYTRTRVHASETGFLAINTNNLRFSLDQGLPGTVL